RVPVRTCTGTLRCLRGVLPLDSPAHCRRRADVRTWCSVPTTWSDDRMRQTLTAAGRLAAVGLVAACSRPAALPAVHLEAQAETPLEEQVGQRPDISCPEDLPAEVGATIECELTAEGMAEAYGVTMTVTDVADDGNVGFDIAVDEEPK